MNRRGESALILHSPDETSPKVMACSNRAFERGIRPGMPLAEARGLTPRGEFRPSDPAADREHLRQLAWQCLAWTPRAGLEDSDSPTGLFLDLTGCVPHFGESHHFGRQVRDHFRGNAYDVRIGVAPTWGAAWAIARECSSRRPGAETRLSAAGDDDSSEPVPWLSVIEDPGAIEDALRRLPVDRLRLPRETLAVLEECGLRTIGNLLDLSRAALPSRYGETILRRLDQALGRREELLTPEHPPVPVCNTARFETPLVETASLQPFLQRQLDDLISTLRERRLQTRQVRISWRTEEGGKSDFEIRLLRPTDSSDVLWDLLWLRVESLSLPGGLSELEMEAVPCLPERLRQSTLFQDEGRLEAEFRYLAERLNGRLGNERSLRFQKVEDFQPEREFRLVPWGDDRGRAAIRDSNSPDRSEPDRPLVVMALPIAVRAVADEVTGRPLRFRWQQRDQIVALCTGPERIVTGWWRGATVARDYFRVETMSGTRFWLFFERPAARWFLQGVFE